MSFYPPLRYPGGKRRLLPVVTRLMDENGLKDIEYAEPYAGGAAIALGLLFEERASKVHLNDLSRPVYAFWRTVLDDTADICRRIKRVNVTMTEWHRQHAVYDNRQSADLADLGFAAFFLNRTNRSGIINGGVIGGKYQTGAWSVDARFNKDDLIQRIRRVGRYASRIALHQLDALDFTKRVVSKFGPQTFTFYDPPYIENGQDLYLNDYDLNGHKKLAAVVARLEHPWVVTYDSAAVRTGLYPGNRRMVYGLNYSAQDRYEGREVMFLSDRLALPKEWRPKRTVRLARRGNRNPFFGRLENVKPERSGRSSRQGGR